MDTTQSPAVNRISHAGRYEIFDGLPRNPQGRTGISGRGLLGRWGPNHAADAVVTRLKTDSAGNPIKRGGNNIVEVALVVRRDNGERALPGGFVEPMEDPLHTARREFAEEAMDSLKLAKDQRALLMKHLENVMGPGLLIHKGVSDDPRNTDNAWIETAVYLFHETVAGRQERKKKKKKEKRKRKRYLSFSLAQPAFFYFLSVSVAIHSQ